MNPAQARIAISGTLFILIFLSGILLGLSGRPINTLLLTAHKLLGLGALVYLAVTVYQVNQVAPLSAVEIIAGLAFRPGPAPGRHSAHPARSSPTAHG